MNPFSSPEGCSALSLAGRYTLAFLRNHPSTNNFSLADIATFVQAREIGLMSVVTNQAEVYMLLKSYDFNYRKVFELGLKVYDAYSAGKFSHEEAVKAFLRNCIQWGVSYERSK